jgi:hypothetical protein
MRRLLTTKNLIRIGFMALSLSSIGVAHSEEASLQGAVRNFYAGNSV